MNFDPSSILDAATHRLGCRGALAAVSVNGIVESFSAGSAGAEDHGRQFYIYSISKKGDSTIIWTTAFYQKLNSARHGRSLRRI